MLIARLQGQRLDIKSDTVVSDSIKFLQIKFEFSEEWQGYAKTAVFKTSDGNSYLVALIDGGELYLGNDTCYAPQEVIAAPQFTVSVFGSKGDSRITSSEARVNVEKSGLLQGEIPQEPTLSIYDQIIVAAGEACSKALSVENAAKNGEFKGDKGDKGDSYIITDADKEEIAENVRKEYFSNIESALERIIQIEDEILGVGV